MGKTRSEKEMISYIVSRVILNEKGCWLWPAAKSVRYGNITWKRKQRHLHDLVWFLFYGEKSKDLNICHVCDEGLCCNPTHLFLGTQSVNLIDASKKGRMNAKVQEKDIVAIRSDPRPLKLIADDYGMTISGISKIKTRRNWFWV